MNNMFHNYMKALACAYYSVNNTPSVIQEIAPNKGHAVAYLFTAKGHEPLVIYQPDKVTYWVVTTRSEYLIGRVASETDPDHTKCSASIRYVKGATLLEVLDDEGQGFTVRLAPDFTYSIQHIVK